MRNELIEKFQEKLEEEMKAEAIRVANDYLDGYKKYYDSLIEKYYGEYTGRYDRTNNFKHSGTLNIDDFNDGFITASFIVDRGKMDDYMPNKERKKKLSADRFISKFIFNEQNNTTYHGGDWHGGYGRPASISFYGEMRKFDKDFKKQFN